MEVVFAFDSRNMLSATTLKALNNYSFLSNTLLAADTVGKTSISVSIGSRTEIAECGSVRG